MSHAGMIIGIPGLEVVRVRSKRCIDVWARPYRRQASCPHCGCPELRIKATHRLEVGYSIKGLLAAPPVRPEFLPDSVPDIIQDFPFPDEFPIITKIVKVGVHSSILMVLDGIFNAPNAGDPDGDAVVAANNYGFLVGAAQARHNSLGPDGTGEDRALIGETQKRVDDNAPLFNAVAISGVSYGDYWFPGGLDTELKKKLALEFNRAWLNGIMAASYTIFDIGRDLDKSTLDVSCFYQMERRQIIAMDHPYYHQQWVDDTRYFEFESTTCQW